MKVLNEAVEHWYSILLYHLERKLDSDTNQLWCRRKSSEREISFARFLKFLEDRIFELECVEPHTGKTSSNRVRSQSAAYLTSVQDCVCCNGEHPLYQCQKFKDLSISQRIQLVYDKKLCLNCLRPSHFVNKCKGSLCRIYNSRHNTLLHRPKESDQ